jgi:hypothetical protein
MSRQGKQGLGVGYHCSKWGEYYLSRLSTIARAEVHVDHELLRFRIRQADLQIILLGSFCEGYSVIRLASDFRRM